MARRRFASAMTKKKIDLLLTDAVLPHGNSGPELAAALSKKWRQMKVLMMTGYAEGDDRPDYSLIQKPHPNHGS